MRKLILSIALLGSAAAAMPASAQDYRGQTGYNNGYGQNYGYNNGGYNQSSQRLRQIGWQIERGVRSGQLNGREAFALRREYSYLVQLDRRLSQGGQTRWERATLNQRTANLEVRLRQYQSTGYGNQGRGYDDRDGQYGNRDGQYGNRDWRDANRDGRDDRDGYERDDRR